MEMSSINLNIRIQPDIKEQAKQVFNAYGLDMTTAVNIFFRKVIATQGIPFDLRPDTPNAETLAAIKEAEDIAANPDKRKSYDNFQKYLKDQSFDV
jgi:DNA-damage-inducible protein J